MVPITEPLARFGISGEQLVEFAMRYQLRELALFGSVLSEDFRADSDVDVLIDLQPGDEMTLEKFVAMKDELERLFGRSVDLVEKPLVQNPYRRAHIIRTRQVLHAA